MNYPFGNLLQFAMVQITYYLLSLMIYRLNKLCFIKQLLTYRRVTIISVHMMISHASKMAGTPWSISPLIILVHCDVMILVKAPQALSTLFCQTCFFIFSSFSPNF